MNTGTIIFIVAVLVAAFIVWAYRSDAKLKRENPEEWRSRQLKIHKNRPDRLRELGASEDEIAQAEAYQAKKATQKAQWEQQKADRQYNASGPGGATLRNNILTYKGKKHDVTGADVVLENGNKRERMTVTRVLAGSTLGAAGPLDTLRSDVRAHRRRCLCLRGGAKGRASEGRPSRRGQGRQVRRQEPPVWTAPGWVMGGR